MTLQNHSTLCMARDMQDEVKVCVFGYKTYLLDWVTFNALCNTLWKRLPRLLDTVS